MKTRFPRRAFLHGLGACLALPTFESLVAAGSPAATLATTPGGMPLRLGFIAFANGSNYERWVPKGEGRGYEMNETFAPMKELRDKFQILTHLAHDTANNWGDGPGDHARAGASFLTGCHAWKTLGSRLHLGISVDQVAARQVGHLTRIDSLQLGVEGTRLYGACDTGYPCAYQYNISWASETLPLSPEPNPRAVFERLFGAGSGEERKARLRERLERRKSILDFVLADARRLHGRLGRGDQGKLAEYLEGVRRIETQIEKIEQFPLPNPDREQPAGIPARHEEHVDLMYDLMALAFQTDSTRVISYCVAPEGSNRPFLELGIAEGYHFLTHHAGNREKILKVAKIERWYMERFARFLRTLDGMKDADGRSVLDNSMIVYGCAIGDGNRHNHDELPVVLAGSGGGQLRPGRHVATREFTPMTNLYTAMLARARVQAERVGDSTGTLEDI
ncbi:MAG: DUF1552 domain-containing protein [Verrucomicrobia bacterium]|nr:DUF1552 domain-containing protein [Verrucomicrobiota bacterium]